MTYTLPDGIYLNGPDDGVYELAFVKGNKYRTNGYAAQDWPFFGAPLPAHSVEWERLADLPDPTAKERP